MAGFIGHYECKLDAKGRLLFPSGLKKQIDPSANESFVMNRGFEGCLVLYPQNEWEVETNRMAKLNLYIGKNRQFIRQFHNGATPLQLDSTGRLLVPKHLRLFGEITTDVVLFAHSNRIELWSKSRYDVVMSQGEASYEDLAEQVMGGISDDSESAAPQDENK